MTFHAEALSEAQIAVLAEAAPYLTDLGFYLGGGTAVALHLGHRRSHDFGWLTGASFEPLSLAETLRDRGLPLVTDEIAPGTFHGSVYNVRLTFLEYDYPLLRSPLVWATYGCALASLDDLACMKLVAIAQRGSRKDFVDIYALGREHLSLERMLELYRCKYNIDDLAHLLYALAYFEDAEEEVMPSMLWDVGWTEMKRAIQGWVKTIA